MRVVLRWSLGAALFACVFFILNARQQPVELFKTDDERASFVREIGADDAISVIVLKTSWCGACRALEDSLVEAQIPFADVDIERSRAGARIFERAVNAGSSRAVPKVILGRFLVDQRDVFADGALTATPAPEH